MKENSVERKKNSNYRLIVVFVFSSSISSFFRFHILWMGLIIFANFFPDVCLIIFKILEIWYFFFLNRLRNFIKFGEICGFQRNFFRTFINIFSILSKFFIFSVLEK